MVLAVQTLEQALWRKPCRLGVESAAHCRGGVFIRRPGLVSLRTRGSMGFTKQAEREASSPLQFPAGSPAREDPPFPGAAEPRDVSDSAIILEPIREDGREVLLLFVPGALTAGDAYLPLGKEIQSVSVLRLWVVFLDVVMPDVASPELVDLSYEGVMKRVQSKGFGAAGGEPSVIIGGHSWGAWQSRSVALRRADGFIQTGSCFWGNPDSLPQYPKPVLTITGELDGQITLATAVAHLGQILDVEAELGEHNTVAVKPVIVIKGMNHAQVSHGVPNKQRGDLDADIPIEEARAQVALAIASFLAVHSLPEDALKWEEAFASLGKCVQQTKETFGSFLEAIKQQGNGAKEWQVQVASVPGLSVDNISVVHHDYYDNFLYSKPSVDPKRKRIQVHTYLKPLNRYEIVFDIWVKMKRSEAVSLHFGTATDVPDVKRLAARFNEDTFNKALEQVPEAARQKFLTRGKKLRFVDDKLAVETSIAWLQSDITIVDAADGSGFTDLQSPILMTPLTGLPPRFSGMHYMKLLTSARAFQWILVDAFR